jgi:hypothetical protein
MFFYSTNISIYHIYVVIYQLDINSIYQQIGFHIFCKKIFIMTVYKKDNKYQSEKIKLNNKKWKELLTCSQFHFYQKFPQTHSIPPLTLHQSLWVQPNWWERNLPQGHLANFCSQRWVFLSYMSTNNIS